MFTWICPKCGTEVPPSYNDCPNCAAREKAAAAPLPVQAPVAQPAPAAPAPAPQQYAPQPQYAAPAPQPQYVTQPAPAQYTQPPLVGTAPTETAPPMSTYNYGAPPPASGGMPSWLIAVLSIAGVAALGFGVIHFMRDKTTAADSPAALESPSAPTNSPLAKYIEVVGFRIVESKQQVQLKFIVVNHAAGDIAPFDLELQVRAKNAKPDDAPMFTVKTPVSGVGPYEAKDMTIPVKTSLRAYELPDWQFLTATFNILQP